MNEPASDHDLIRVWRSNPQVDTQSLMQNLAAQNRTRRIQATVILALLGAVSLLLVLAEIAGKLGTHGLLSLLWLTCLAVGALLQNRAHRGRVNALASDTRGLLKFMIRRARRGLTLARCLYAGTPTGAMMGWLLTTTIDPDAGRGHHVASLQAAAGAALLVMMILAGLVFARRRRAELMNLEEKQSSLQSLP